MASVGRMLVFLFALCAVAVSGTPHAHTHTHMVHNLRGSLRRHLLPHILESESSDMQFISTVPPPLYAKPLDNTALANVRGPIFRSVLDFGPEYLLDGATTSYENFENTVKKHPNRAFLGVKKYDEEKKKTEYKFQTYKRIAERRTNFASGLQSLKLVDKGSDGLRMLGMYMPNRMEWVIAEQAVFTFRGVTVPMFDTALPETVASIIATTKLHTLLSVSKQLSKLLLLPKIFKDRKETMPLKTVIVVENEAVKEFKEQFKLIGIDLITFQSVESVGKKSPHAHRPPAGHEIATMCFTSGTTGEPKGAIITHSNLVTEAAAIRRMGITLESSDIHLSYLPLPHMFERMIQFSIVHAGGSIGFYSGDVKQLKDDLLTLRPTIFPTVPRVLNKFLDEMKKSLVASTMVSILNESAKSLAKGKLVTDSSMSKIIKKQMGLDRVRLMLTGSAPVTAKVLIMFRLIMGVPFVEGFGQTESTAGSTLTFLDDYSVGHVGGPMPCNEITLFDVPELGYVQTDTEHVSGNEHTKCVGRGEVGIRGSNVMKGYYQLPDQTAEAIDRDGWLHTGDIGCILPNGALKIIDRKKNIFKLSQGEYVAPDKLESIYTSTLVSQIYVHGDPLESAVVAIVVPNPELLQKYKLKPENAKEITNSASLRTAIQSDLQKSAEKFKVPGFEKVKAFYVEPEPFSVEGGLLTPTYKNKRSALSKKYQEVIKTLYAGIRSKPASD